MTGTVVSTVHVGACYECPTPRKFSRLGGLILRSLNFRNGRILLASKTARSLCLYVRTLLTPRSGIILSSPKCFVVKSFTGEFTGRMECIPVCSRGCNCGLAPSLLERGVSRGAHVIVLVSPLGPLNSSCARSRLGRFTRVTGRGSVCLLRSIACGSFTERRFLIRGCTPNRALAVCDFSGVFKVTNLEVNNMMSSGPVVSTVGGTIMGSLKMGVVSRCNTVTNLGSGST